MKVLFDMQVLEGRRVKAAPSAYLRSLSREAQIREVGEFLQWIRTRMLSVTDREELAELEIGRSTAETYLQGIGADGAG